MTTVIKLNGITLPGGGYPKLSSFESISLSITSGLLGLYSFEDTLSDSLRNYANADLPLTATGAPTFTAGGVVCNIDNCFDTGIAQQSAFTFVAIAKPIKPATNDAGAFLVSDFYSPASGYGGDGIGFRNGSLISGVPVLATFGQNSASNYAASEVSVSAFDINNAAFFIGTGSVDTGLISGAGTNGSLTMGNNTALAARGTTGGTLLIGGHRRASGTLFKGNTGPIYASAIYNRVLTSDEINTVYSELRQYAANRDLTTV
ncbi:hypothetical protein [Rahnella aquatilis]|uniref:hypothetical protein n=1 Tax=Rahnella aquatilis TaxID=34038 RepID=UPI0036595E5E